MTRLALLVAMSALCACDVVIEPEAPEVEQGPVEEEVRDLVWNEYFQAETAPPTVVWWYDPCPTGNGNGGENGNGAANDKAAVAIDGKCYAGLFRPEIWQADVAWGGKFSRSAYSHELMHAWQRERGIDDPGHSNEEWRMVDEIDIDLAARGL